MKKIINFKNLAFCFMLVIGLNQTYSQCTFTGLNSTYCTNSASTALTPGITGGTFSGPGVTGSSFNPAVAGPGTHTINYNICSTVYSISTPSFALTSTVGTNVPASAFSPNSDDGLTTSLPIGFTFKFFCNSYTGFYIGSNGFITFSNNAATGCCSGQSIPNTSTPNDLIAYSWTDLNHTSGGTTTYSTTGTAPNRILTISFVGIPFYSGGNGPISSQIKLYETSNIIEIHTSSNPGNSGYATTMGIENISGTAAYPVSGRNSVAGWTATNECQRFTPGASCNVNQTTVVSPSTITVVGNSSICVGSTASLTATGNTSYTWSTASNSNSISVAPSSSTTYSVAGTNSFGCIANSAITVTVDNTPTVTANSSNGTSGICPGRTVSLNGGGATSYTWTGGSPTVTNGVAFTIGSASAYTVNGANACGSASAAITLSIHPLPTVNAIASSASLCSGSTLTLTGVGNATNYVWSGGPIPITNGGSFTPLTTITYTLIGTSALTCTASTTTVVTVVNTPNAFPTSNPPLICVGGSSTLTATGATNYTWTSATQTINTANFVVSPTVGITTYTVTKANSNCVDTKTINVVTNALPTIFAIVTPTVVCALTPATLAVGGALTYTWTAPGPPSYTFTGASPITSPVGPSTYSVAASDGTCINTTTVFLNANPNPTIVASASSPTTCGGEIITLSATGGVNYTWTSTGTASSSAQSFTDSPTVPTAYNVTGDNSFGCTASANQVVLVLASPTITATRNPTLVCSGSPATVTASGANTYTWSSNAGGALTTAAVVNPTSPISGPITFTVEGTNSQTGCKSTRTVVVNVFVPSLSASGNTNTCAGGNVTLTILGGNSNYNWNTGSSNVSAQIITASLTAPAIFTLSANTLSAGVTCPSTNTVELGIYYNPTITAVADRTTICRTESVDITAGGGIAYTWNTGSTNTVLTVSPTGNIINYTVTGTDANGCSSTASVQIKISGCVGLTELNSANAGLNIYPNPNNGLFNIEANTAIKLNLVNELGQLVRVITLSDANNYKVSVTDLAKGIYFIAGQKGEVQIYQKIVVTR